MFAIPSLDQCVQKTRAAFRAALPGTDAWIWPNNIGPTAKVIGGATSELYGRLDYIGRQRFASTASGKYLDLHGAESGTGPRKDAVAASGTVLVTANAAVVAAAGAQFQRSDGVVLTAAATVVTPSAGVSSVPVLAAVAAQAGNSQPSTPLTILSGVSGSGAASATAAVDAVGLSGGLDREPDGPFYSRDLATYRGRILFRKANPPHGGNAADYVLWCGSVPGVTRTYVERRYNGPGSVRVYPLFDGLFPGGIPDAPHLALVSDVLATVAPAAADVAVVAATPHPIAVAVQDLTPYTITVENAVIDELADTFQRLGQVAGTDVPVASLPFLAVPFSFAAIWIDQAIANATGSRRAVVGAPVADIVMATGEIPMLGSVSFP